MYNPGSILLSIVLFFILAPIAAPPVLAQQPGTEPFREIAGPYDISLVSVPSTLSIGQVTFAVNILNAVNQQPISDANVVVRVTHELDGEEGYGLAVHTTDIPERYNAVMNLNSPGIWRVSIEVSGALGKVEVEAPPIELAAPRRSLAGSLVFVFVSVVLILGASYVTWTIRRAQQKRDAANVG